MSPQERAAHTAGPWMVAEKWNSADVRAVGGPFVASCNASFGIDWTTKEANARLIAAAPDLLEAQTMGAEVNTPDFLDWVADRMVHVYGESPLMDYVQSLRRRAAAGRTATAKATGTQP